MTRRKLPSPLSPSDALWSSIMALTDPDEFGRSLWQRAQVITGHPVSSLKKWATGERSVPLEVVEALDLANAIAGGPATNRDAWSHRHNSGLEGVSAGGQEPMRYLKRALEDLTEAARMVRFGKGEVTELRQIQYEITLVCTELMEAIFIRNNAEASEEQRAHPTRSTLARRGTDRLHLVEDDDQEAVG